jgi:hypothetical protein
LSPPASLRAAVFKDEQTGISVDGVFAGENYVIEAINRIMAIEANRGDIPRSVRSSLDPAARPYQDLIDRIIYAMAGLTLAKSIALEGTWI